MKTVNVRELRAAIPRLKDELAVEQELVLISNGEPVARILPIAPKAAVRPRLPSLKAFRDTMPLLETPVEVLIREERDRR